MSLVRATVTDGVAEIVLNRPDAGNALDPALVAAFGDAVAGLAGRDDVRVALLRAEGKMFSVGGDLGFFAGADDRGAALRALANDLHRGVRALLALDVPIVVAVQGPAAGAGMSLACAADLVIAGASASFTVAYTAVGLSPDGGASWTLPRLVGPRRAAELMLTNRRVRADEALAIGLVSEVVADDQLEARAAELARTLADGPAEALRATRRLLRESADRGLDAQLDAERDGIAARAASAEGAEGIEAFLARRAPRFRAVGSDA